MFLPKANESPDFQFVSILAQHPELIQPRSEEPIAARFCSNSWGPSLELVDCRSGVISKGQTAIFPWGGAEALITPEIEIALQQRQLRLERLRSLVEASAIDKNLLFPIQSLLEKRLVITNQLLNRSDVQNIQSYSNIFSELLLLDGYRYDFLSGKFIPLRYDIVRALEKEANYVERIERTKLALVIAPYFVFLFCFVWLSIGFRARNLNIRLLVCGMLGLSVFGLLICADAAVRFGAQGSVYSLNPLSATLPNQLLWIAIMSLLAILLVKILSLVEANGLRSFPWVASKVNYFYRNIKFAHLVFLGTLSIAGAYKLFSPAVGAETLKVIVCVLSGVLLSQHGREVFLVRKYVPNSFSFRSFWESLTPLDGILSTPIMIHRLFLRSYLLFVFFGLFTVGMTAFGFGDLGGTAVAVCIVLILTLLLYGWPLFTCAITLGVIAVSLALKTTKVQDRLALMLEPSSAAVSDFARLITFEESLQPYGQGIGALRWCNELGVCVPLQVLSDYMPIVVSASVGRTVSVLVFLMIFLGSLFFAYRALIFFASTNSRLRVVVATAFFLFVSTGVQTVITFFGNWRLLPLTGLGVPFMSIGISSIVAGYLAVCIMLAYDLCQSTRRL